MKITNTITIAIIGIIAFAISQTIIELLNKKSKAKAIKDGAFPLAYGIWYSALVISSSILIFKTLTVNNVAIDTILGMAKEKPYENIFKTSVIFWGINFCWLLFGVFLNKMFSNIFFGKRTIKFEIENNNYVYFLMRGVLLIGFIYILLPVFELTLRFFLPNIDVPFYR